MSTEPGPRTSTDPYTIAGEAWTTLREIDALIEGVKAQHARDIAMYPQRDGDSVYRRMDINGRPILADLLAARAATLHTLALLMGTTVDGERSS